MQRNPNLSCAEGVRHTSAPFPAPAASLSSSFSFSLSLWAVRDVLLVLVSSAVMLSSLARPRWRSLPLSSRFGPSTRHGLSTASAQSASRQSSRVQRYTRRAAIALVAGGLAYGIDREYNASAIARNLRTLWTVSALPLCPRNRPTSLRRVLDE